VIMAITEWIPYVYVNQTLNVVKLYELP
jgi:hypothetical protein